MIQDPSLYHAPPQSLEMEESILSSCLIDDGAAILASDNLDPGDFYKTAHQLIFRRIKEQVLLKKPTDLPSIVTCLKNNNEIEAAGGAFYIAGLINDIPIAENIEDYCSVVRQKKDLRRLIEQCNSATKAAFNGDADAIDKHYANVSKIAMGQKEGGFRHISEIVDESIERLEKIKENRNITGVPSGYEDLDEKTCGFQEADLIIIAGRPSMGKTAFALNCMKNQCYEGRTCAFFSLEMADPQICNRFLAMDAEVDGNKFRSGALARIDWNNIMRSADDISNWKLYIDDTAKLSYQSLIRRARQLQSKVGLEMLYIDYLGFIDGDKDLGRRDLEVGSITRNLKAFAKDINIPIVLLVQLSRACESRTDKRPLLSDLRDSGDIEQDADCVIFLYRDEVYDKNSPDKGKAELLIRKQRNGPTGMVGLQWDEKTTLFRSLFKNHPGSYGHYGEK